MLDDIPRMICLHATTTERPQNYGTKTFMLWLLVCQPFVSLQVVVITE